MRVYMALCHPEISIIPVVDFTETAIAFGGCPGAARAIAVCRRIRSTARVEVGAEILVPPQAQLGAYVVAVKVDRARGPRERHRDVLG